MPAAISASVLLIVIAYIGWWYPRQLRAQFLDLVSKIDIINEGEFRAN
jgi:hypothetical protein